MTTPDRPALVRPEPPRDRFGRYLIPGADGGKPRPWQRVTTFAGMIDDASGLTRWKQRVTAIGLAHRPDLVTELASLPADDRQRLDAVVERAMEHGGGNSAATTGTALHRILERVDAEDPTLTVPEQLKADVDAYLDAMADYRIARPVEWIERIGTHTGYGVAGTLDRIVEADGRLMVADLKTGASLDYAALKIAVQLHCYATFDRLWDPADGDVPMPAVDQDTALVFHLPAGSGRCDVIAVDLRPARRWAELCAEVRDARTASKRKGTVFAPYASPAPPTDPDRAALLARLKALDPTQAAAMRSAWPPDVPPLNSNHAHTAAELAAVEQALERIEQPPTIRDLAVRLSGTIPRGAPTPTPPVDVDALTARRAALPPDALTQFDRWMREANHDGQTLNPRLRPAAAPIVDALLTLAEICDGDEPTALAAIHAAGWPAAGTPVGAAAVTLTPIDTARLHDIITTWALTYQLDGTPTWEPRTATTD